MTLRTMGRAGVVILSVAALGVGAQEIQKRGKTSYMTVDQTESFASIFKRMTGDKPAIERRHQAVLDQRYDLSNRPAKGATMFRGKPLQEGVRAKLREGVTWQALDAMTPEQIRERNAFPDAFKPLPHPSHAEGGMIFPKFHIDEIKRQEGRDLTRFDIDFDLPDQFLPEFPPAIFLTTRTDLGDVSQGKLVTLDTFNEIFNGILNAKDLEGMRLLVTQFPQQQFNATYDRKPEKPTQGAAGCNCPAKAT